MKKIISLLVISSLILTGCSRKANNRKKTDDSGSRQDIKTVETVKSDNSDTDIDIDTDVEIVDIPLQNQSGFLI